MRAAARYISGVSERAIWRCLTIRAVNAVIWLVEVVEDADAHWLVEGSKQKPKPPPPPMGNCHWAFDPDAFLNSDYSDESASEDDDEEDSAGEVDRQEVLQRLISSNAMRTVIVDNCE